MINPPVWKFNAYDGKKRDLAAIECQTCKNVFWIEHAEVEIPTYCPYCGVRFEGTFEGEISPP